MLYYVTYTDEDGAWYLMRNGWSQDLCDALPISRHLAVAKCGEYNSPEYNEGRWDGETIRGTHTCHPIPMFLHLNYAIQLCGEYAAARASGEYRGTRKQWALCGRYQELPY